MHLFVIKLGIVMHHHEPEYHAEKNVMRKKMGVYLPGQGHSVGLYNQNMMAFIISFIGSKPISLL